MEGSGGHKASGTDVASETWGTSGRNGLKRSVELPDTFRPNFITVGLKLCAASVCDDMRLRIENLAAPK